MQTITGNLTAARSWFTQKTDANSEASEMIRDEILDRVYQMECFGVQGQQVIFRIPGGRLLARAETVQGSLLVFFDYIEYETDKHINFWMNAASVADIGGFCRHNPQLRTDFNHIFCN